MTMRRTAGALMIAALALVGAACSSDSKSDSADSKKTTTTDAVTTTTAKPLSDDDYLAQVDAITAKLTAAGTDICTLTAATGEGPPEPSNTTQVKAAVGLYTALLNAVANSFPAENATSADALRTAATNFSTAAETAGYPKDFFSSEEATAALSGEGYNAAMTDYQTIYTSNCATEATTTTAPAG